MDWSLFDSIWPARNSSFPLLEHGPLCPSLFLCSSFCFVFFLICSNVTSERDFFFFKACYCKIFKIICNFIFKSFSVSPFDLWGKVLLLLDSVVFPFINFSACCHPVTWHDEQSCLSDGYPGVQRLCCNWIFSFWAARRAPIYCYSFWPKDYLHIDDILNQWREGNEVDTERVILLVCKQQRCPLTHADSDCPVSTGKG